MELIVETGVCLAESVLGGMIKGMLRALRIGIDVMISKERSRLMFSLLMAHTTPNVSVIG